MAERAERTTPRIARIAAIAGIAIVVGGVIGWAGATALTPPQDVLARESFTYVEVSEGEIGASMSLNTVAEWRRSPIAVNQAQGVVTSVAIEPGAVVDQGDVLYATNLRPTVAAQGDTPAFRSLQRGAAGPDVAQLQALLKALGYYKGDINSEFKAATAAATREWQRSLGVNPDGIVQPGDIVFVAALPTKLILDPETIDVGSTVSGGEKAIWSLANTPRFSIPVTAAQATAIVQGTRVEIAAPDGSWEAQVGTRETADSGETTLHLEGLEGKTICGDQCDGVPVTGQTLLLSKIVTVEATTGLVLPVAAIRSSADGSLSVIDEEGEEHPVSIVATAKGMSVVEGVPTGLRVRVPADGS